MGRIDPLSGAKRPGRIDPGRTGHRGETTRIHNNSKSFLIFKQFDMKEEVNLRIEYDLLLNKKLILLLAFL